MGLLRRRLDRSGVHSVASSGIPYVRKYGSVTEMVEIVKKARIAGRTKASGCSPSDAYFIGRKFSNWKEIDQAATAYWEDGVKIIEHLQEELRHERMPTPRSIKRRRIWSPDDGDNIDLDRLRSGQDYWQGMERRKVASVQHLTVVTQFGGRGYLGSEQLIWRGAATVALCDILENEGYRVELWGANEATGAHGSSKPHSLRIAKLKESQSQIDVALLANFVSGWFYRTIGIPEHGTETQAALQNCGGTISIPEAHLQEALGIQDFVLIQDVYSKDETMELIRNVVAELNKET